MSNKWLTLHQFDTCQSRTEGYWGVLIITWCCYNSLCSEHVVSLVSSSFFQQDNAVLHSCLRQSTFVH